MWECALHVFLHWISELSKSGFSGSDSSQLENWGLKPPPPKRVVLQNNSHKG